MVTHHQITSCKPIQGVNKTNFWGQTMPYYSEQYLSYHTVVIWLSQDILPKNFTCQSCKQSIELASCLIGKSTSPRLLDRNFFAHCLQCSLQTGSPYGLFRDLLSSGARVGERGRACNGPCTIWVLPLFRLTDLSSCQIEMNQSQRKRKWPCRSRRLSKMKLLIDVFACKYSYPETLKKTFRRKAGRKPFDL